MQENNPPPAPPAANLVQRLDPRSKLALLLASFLAVLLPQRPEIVGLATFLVLGHLALARAWGELYRIRWLLLILALFSIASLRIATASILRNRLTRSPPKRSCVSADLNDWIGTCE